MNTETEAKPLESIIDVLEYVRAHGLSQYAQVVGRWVWLEFDSKPSDETRAGLSAIGFRWNHKRRCWQHPCGHHTTGSPADTWYLKSKYGCARVAAGTTTETETAAA